MVARNDVCTKYIVGIAAGIECTLQKKDYTHSAQVVQKICNFFLLILNFITFIFTNYFVNLYLISILLIFCFVFNL